MSEYVRITDRKIELTDEGVEALMSDYTPTTKAIRRGYSRVGSSRQQREEAFDRWLAEIKAEVWEEGLYAGAADNYFGYPDNPYRHGEEQ